MKWTHKIAALATALMLMSPSVASAYYWYGSPYYAGYTAPRPTTTSTTAAKTMTTATAPASTAATSVEQTLLQLTNQERIKNGLAPLVADSALATAARAKSSDMKAKNYFSHTSPTYGSPAQLLTRFGISYMAYAENIAKGPDAARIHAMWMNSPGHRANILNARFNRIGIGVAGSTGSYAATQLFINR